MKMILVPYDVIRRFGLRPCKLCPAHTNTGSEGCLYTIRTAEAQGVEPCGPAGRTYAYEDNLSPEMLAAIVAERLSR